MRRLSRLATVLTLAAVGALLAPLTAMAVGYQFWGFYQLSADGEWGFATEGPATTVPEDGSVEGFRFAVSSGDDVRLPRAVLTFDEICGDTPAEDGMKRVGLVVDPGRDVDAPEGQALYSPGAQCVVAEQDATSQDVVDQAAGELRVENGLICAIAGFPGTGCGDEVAEATPEQSAVDEEIEIPVIPAGEPIIAAVDGDGAEPTGDDGTETGAATDDATSSEEATGEATDGTAEETTAEETGAATGEETGQETGTDEETNEQATDEATGDDTDNATPVDAEDQDGDSNGGIPAWVWIVGIVVLLGALVWGAGAARNRRLDEAEKDWPANGQDQDYGPGQNPQDGPGHGGPNVH